MSQINAGDTLPDATFTVMTADGPSGRSTSDIFGGRTVAVFAVPGAFTPTCNNNHLPSFLDKADELKAKGVDEIACIAVNDVFVMDAWSKSTASAPDITMLADGNGDFTRAIGMELDITGHGLGHRSKRYAMLVTDGKVQSVLVEDNPGVAENPTPQPCSPRCEMTGRAYPRTRR